MESSIHAGVGKQQGIGEYVLGSGEGKNEQKVKRSWKEGLETPEQLPLS